MGAYDDAAGQYLTSGWWPIPVRGKSLPTPGTTGYDGTVTAEKVTAWLDTDLDSRARAGRGVGVENIGVRHHLTLAIDVDEGYGDKRGVTQLAAWAQKLGLEPLPATWSSTARGPETASRQHFYRITDDAKFKTKPCESVELCTWHHRFSVVWPAVHPGTGTTYTWYAPGTDGVPPTWGPAADRQPRVEELPMLPARWFDALRGGVANADRDAVVVALPELMATFPEGDPDPLVRYLIEKWSDPGQHVGHDEAKNALIHALMIGREGRTGVRELFRVIVRRYRTYLATARADVAELEAQSLIAACTTIAQQKPIRSAPDTARRDREFTTAATDEELATFLATYTRHTRPDRLGRRKAWMLADRPQRIGYHAQCLVSDAMSGYYPAQHALRALAQGYQRHGGQDPRASHDLLSVALGAVLNTKVAS